MNTAFTELLQVKADCDKRIRTEGEHAIKTFFKDYFEQNPQVYGIKWEQYTPYFNDGDECVFRLGGVYTFATADLFIQDIAPYDCDDPGVKDHYRDPLYNTLEEILEILQMIFGDNAQIAITRESIVVTEYDHE